MSKDKIFSVKEIFYSLQGEGARSGRPAVFCRFTGCNAWSGLDKDKATSACPFCDTDFVGVDGQGGGKYSNKELVEKLTRLWPLNRPENNKMAKPYIVFTGGEPLLQLDAGLIDAMHNQGFEVAVETNGSLNAPENIDWICVSPKVGMDLIIKKGNELKLLYPQAMLKPELFTNLEFEQFFLQPIDDTNENEGGINCQATNHQKLTIDYCLKNPQWHYSFQLHKLLNID